MWRSSKKAAVVAQKTTVMSVPEDELSSHCGSSADSTAASTETGGQTCSRRTSKSTSTPIVFGRYAEGLDRDYSVKEMFSVEKFDLLSVGFMCKARRRSDGLDCSLELVSRSPLGRATENVVREVDLMMRLQHSSIIGLFDCFRERHQLCFVTEICDGGRLSERLEEGTGYLEEAQAAGVMRQLLSGVDHMHQRGVCHRNLTVENILLAHQGTLERNTIKVTGFEFACAFSVNPMGGSSIFRDKPGTLAYMAPEVIIGPHRHTCDLWNCGVIMYRLLCGVTPFHGTTPAEVSAKVQQGVFEFTQSLSDDATDLTRQLINLTANARPTPSKALEHSWFDANPEPEKLALAWSDGLYVEKTEDSVASLHWSYGARCREDQWEYQQQQQEQLLALKDSDGNSNCSTCSGIGEPELQAEVDEFALPADFDDGDCGLDDMHSANRFDLGFADSGDDEDVQSRRARVRRFAVGAPGPLNDCQIPEIHGTSTSFVGASWVRL